MTVCPPPPRRRDNGVVFPPLAAAATSNRSSTPWLAHEGGCFTPPGGADTTARRGCIPRTSSQSSPCGAGPSCDPADGACSCCEKDVQWVDVCTSGQLSLVGRGDFEPQQCLDRKAGPVSRLRRSHQRLLLFELRMVSVMSDEPILSYMNDLPGLRRCRP